jgi:probable F420-dependent oxidoreductase
MSLSLGAVFPTTEIGSDPVAIRDWAQAAESLGFDHAITYDHVLGAVHADREPRLMGPYTENDPFHEPFVLFGFLAAVTTRLGLVSGVIILPQRQTALVAKQAAEVDALSGGRLRLGVGTGWNWVEYDALGERFDDRGRRFDEQVELLRRLWREPIVDFQGDHHRIDRAGILPLPGRDIPVWFGAMSDVAIRRAARIGDGVLFATKPSRVRRLHGLLKQGVEAAGREQSAVGVEAIIDFADGPDVWREEIELWREAGGTHLSIRAMDTGAELMGTKRMGYAGPADYIRALESFKKEIG